MAEKNLRNTVILAKVETTYGTDANPGATDAVLCGIPDYGFSPDKRERNFVRTSLSPLGFAVGAKRQTITIPCELKGAGPDGSDAKKAGQLDSLFQMCGMASSAVTGPPAYRKYVPTTKDPKSGTIYYYLDGILYKLLGTIGTFQAEFVADGYASVNFQMTGLHSAPSDTAVISVTAWEEHMPPPCLSIGLTVGSYTPTGVERITVDLGATISEKKDMQNTSGLSKLLTTARAPKVTVEMDMDSLAKFNPFNYLSSNTLTNLSWSIGSSTGNIVSVSVPEAQLEDIKVTNRDGRGVYSVTFLCTGEDDEIEIQTK